MSMYMFTSVYLKAQCLAHTLLRLSLSQRNIGPSTAPSIDRYRRDTLTDSERTLDKCAGTRVNPQIGDIHGSVGCDERLGYSLLSP